MRIRIERIGNGAARGACLLLAAATLTACGSSGGGTSSGGGGTGPPSGTWVECIPGGGGCYLVPGNSLSNVTTGDESFDCQPIKPGFTPTTDNPCGYGADAETPSEGVTGNGTNSGQTQAISQAAKAAIKQVKLHPNYALGWSNLEQAYWEAAHQTSDYDSTTGGYTTTGKKYLTDATGAWQRYLGLTKSPNADAAILAAEAYASLAQYKQEASSWQYVTQTNPSSAKGYECLAFSAYAAKETRLASLAAAQALRRAPKLEKLELKSALSASKTQPGYAQEC